MNETQGKIKEIREEKTFGAKGFRKREMILVSDEQYPQTLMIEFIQDNCDKLDNFKEGDSVKISLNLKGREWINKEGNAVYFNSFEGWSIAPLDGSQPTPITNNASPKKATSPVDNAEEIDDLPF